MRLIGTPIEEALFTGRFIGDAKAQVRITVEPDWQLRSTTSIGSLSGDRAPVRYWQTAANDQVEIEIPNVVSYDDDQTVEQPAASCTIVIDNVKMDPNASGSNARLGQPGYYLPHYGRTLEAQARWGQLPNEWSGILEEGALLRSYAGYGGADMTISEAVDAGHLMLQGVWIVDDWQATSSGRLTLQCRNVMVLLLDQPLYAGLVPPGLYPLEFYRYRYENRDVAARAVTSTAVTPGVRSAPGDKRCVLADSSADRWYPQGSPGSYIPSGGYPIHGHRGADCLDGNAATFCLSVGNSAPDRTFCTDWWEFDCGEVINAVYISPWAGNYRCFVSVMENGVWQGSEIVPYTFYSMNGGGYAVDTDADIPYVLEAGVPFEAPIEIVLPRAYLAQKVRVSFRNHHRSGWGPWYYRCGMREIRLRATTHLEYGQSSSTTEYQPIFIGGGALRNPDNLNAQGYITMSAFWQLDAFGDCFIMPPAGRGGAEQATSWEARSVRILSDNSGYYTLGRDGTVLPFGSAVWYGDPRDDGLETTAEGAGVMDLALTPTGLGYWVLHSDGTIYNYGDADALGNAPPSSGAYCYSLDSHPTDPGLWVVDTAGVVTALGSAVNYGDFTPLEGGETPTQLRATGDGLGYWISTDAGRVQGKGSATLHGQITDPSVSTDYRDNFYCFMPSPTDGGYLLMRGDGSIYPFGDAEMFGSPVPGTQGQLRRDGNYFDYVDIVRLIALWSGFHLYNEFDSTGWPAVYGNIESTGAFARDTIPLDFFDKQPPADVLKQLAEIVGYVGPYCDEEGGLHWHSPNFWNYGNFLSDGAYTSEILELDERWNLIEAATGGTRRYDRSEVIISTEEPTEALDTTVTTRFIPPNQRTLHGMFIPAIWVNGMLANADEQRVMAELVALHLWFRKRTAQVTGLFHPGIQINDQIRILDRTTGETAVHYVLGKHTSFEKESGKLTMNLTTHWLGDRDAWAISAGGEFVTAGAPSDDAAERFSLSSLAIATLRLRGVDISSIADDRRITHIANLDSAPDEDGAAS